MTKLNHSSSEMSSTPHQNGVESHRESTNSTIEERGGEVSSEETPVEWEDVEVDIGWGTIRGKITGSGPELCLGVHGWLDNANSFDLFAPHLPKDIRFLSLDLPGHGLSDHFPEGFIYDPRGYMAAIKRTVTALGWRQFTYLGHSMGAVVGIMYTSVFPEDVKVFISIDIIKPWSLEPERQPGAMKKYLLQYFDNEKKTSQPPLVYDEKELLKRTMEGSKSLDERGARILLERGARKTEGGLVLTRDLRVKTFFIGFTSFEEWLQMAKAITCPLLIVKARDGHNYEGQEIYSDMLEAFKEDCKHFHYEEVEGKHHIHLTNTSAVANVLKPFLDNLKCLNGASE